jgi:hypothetical protein
MVFAKLLAGPMVTGLLFTFLYATTTLACLLPDETPAFDFRFISFSLAVAALAGSAYFAVRIANKMADPFLRNVSKGLALAGMLGALWLAFPLMLISDCRA